jgi:hypothetical protein
LTSGDPYKSPRINYGDSSWNTPNRFIAYVTYNLPNLHTNNAAASVAAFFWED